MHKERIKNPEPERRFESGLHFFESVELSLDSRATLTRAIERIVNNPDLFIDKGGAGSVYKFSEGLCMKVIEDRTKSPAAEYMDFGNSPQVEARFQATLAKNLPESVIVPQCYGYYLPDKEGAKPFIIMEHLDAVNLQRAINNEDGHVLPADFDEDSFTQSLEDYIDFMHERGIVHGDLFARNIMVDRRTGKPCVIDFGRSRSLAGLREDKKQNMIDVDIENLDDIFSSLSQLTHN